MAQESKVNFTTPVGRIVMGSVDKPRDKDAEGKPLTIKSGPNAGKPTIQYFIALAIPKNPAVDGGHWANTEWGKLIWNVGHTAFPGMASNPAFAWKVEDGDSHIPNRKNKKPCDNAGFPGNWVLFMSTSLPIKTYNADGSAAIPPESIKRGYYAQVSVMCQGNGSTQNPGIYLNPSMIALAGFGEEIVSGPDPQSAGFGQGVTLPPGASATPIGGMAPGVASAPPVPGVPVPGAPAAYAPPAAPVAPPVVPNPAILAGVPAIPGVPGVPAPAVASPPPPVAPAGPVMTAKAAGQPLKAFLDAGWTMDALKANGYIA